MYHQHPQQQGAQPFPSAARPSHHQPPPNRSNMQGMGFQFPRPNQLPDELESALAIRGGRDMDHRQIDLTNQPNPHQNQGPSSVISQQGGYGSVPADNPSGHQQGEDWSNYQPPAKLFHNVPSNASHQGTQQPQNNQAGFRKLNWNPPISDITSPQARHTHVTRVGGEGQGLYTPESAGSILASFGLSNEDLEVLSHYPDDQLTPDTLPFILRDIQINKSDKQKALASASSFSRGIHKMPLAPSRSPEVPSLLTVTQTAGKVIDYGHASRGKDETFKREPLSSEKTVKMYPTASSVGLKLDQTKRRQVQLEHNEPSKHEDKDYRRTDREKRKSGRSPEREFTLSPKSRNLDRDYTHKASKLRLSSESRSEDSSRPSSSSRPYGNSRKLPTPTMISDFEAASPKVYPHTCSLCHVQCDQEKDWIDHINTVDHTAACRDLRNKYPDWRPNLPSRTGRYKSRALWDPKDGSPFESRSHSPSPSQGRYRGNTYKPPGRSYSPHRHLRPHLYPERSHRFDQRSHSPPLSHRKSLSSREYWSERRSRESAGSFSHIGVKRSRDASKSPPSSSTDQSSKHESSPPITKSSRTTLKPGARTIKMFVKPPPLKKKKKGLVPASLDLSVADRLVFLTGIPKDATEQEVSDLAGSFGKINNVVLMPGSEEEGEKDLEQKASVCMLMAEDAKALAAAANLQIRDQEITASVAKKPKRLLDTSSKPDSDNGSSDVAVSSSGGDLDQKMPDQTCKVLITGLPETSWSRSDIIQLVQPFGTPSDIILARLIGKAVVSLPDLEVAEEMVKVYSFKPAMVNNTEVKMSLLKQPISLSTPVALYNLLMGSLDPLENTGPVGWGSLLVIKNIPDTPSSSSAVIKLVRRFGTVIKTLVLNSMLICEMATAAMAFSVYKRFQTFPCIINNNPLFFLRKADPKASGQTKITAVISNSSQLQDKSSGKDNQSAALAVKATAHQEDSETPLEKNFDEIVKSTEKEPGDDPLGEDNKMEDSKPEVDQLTESTETSITEVNKHVGALEEVTMEKTESVSCDGRAASQERMPQLPKMTQAMVNVLLMECRTRNASHSNNAAAPSGDEQEDKQRDPEQGGKLADVIKDLAENTEEEEVKKQDNGRKEREAKKERRERERRVWEKERVKRERERSEKARREREKREEERREWERRERERREKRRGSGSRSSYRLSSWRDECYGLEADHRKEEEEESGDLPFNLSDFVTVDEVGDVADLPFSPSTVPMETSKKGSGTPMAAQQKVPEDTTVESSVTQLKSEVSESDLVSIEKAEPSGGLLEPHSAPGQELNTTESPLLASQVHRSLKETQYQPDDTGADLQICSAGEKEKGADEQKLMKVSDQHQQEEERGPDEQEVLKFSDQREEEERGPDEQQVLKFSDQREEEERGPDEQQVLKFSDQREEEERGPDEQEVLKFSDQHQQEEERGPDEQKLMKVSDQREEEERGPDEQKLMKVSDQQQEEKTEVTDEAAEPGKAEDNGDTRKETDLKTNLNQPLPSYNPNSPVGLEYLVHKTGFFCKVCSRFFSGAKMAEISHCRTLKHYENLQKFIQKMKP